MIASSSLAIQWELLLLWIGGTVASVACILRRARQSGLPPRVRLLFDAPPAPKRTTPRPAAARQPGQPAGPGTRVADHDHRTAAAGRPDPRRRDRGAPGDPGADQRRRDPSAPGIAAADQRFREPDGPGITAADQRFREPDGPGITAADRRGSQPSQRDAAVSDPRDLRPRDDEPNSAEPPRSSHHGPNR